MKRITVLLLVAALVGLVAVGCGRRAAKQPSGTKVAVGTTGKTGSTTGAAGGKDVSAKPGAGSVLQPDKAPLPANPTAKDVLEHMAAVYKSINSLKAEGTLYQSVSADGESRNGKSATILHFARPNKLRFESSGQTQNVTIVSDGKVLYTYDPQRKLYMKESGLKALKKLQKGSGGVNTPGLLSGMDMTPYIKAAKLKPSEKVAGVDTYVIEFPLGTAVKGVKAAETIWVGKKDFLIRQIEDRQTISPDALPVPPGVKKLRGPINVTNKTVLRSIAADVPIQDSIFRFSPPKGAQEFDPRKMRRPEIKPPPDITGKKAPAFTIPTLGGKQVSLSDYQGKPVLVVFWTLASPMAKNEMPRIQKLYGGLKGGAAVLGVNLDADKKTVAKYVEDNGITFPVLFDPEKAFNTAISYGLINMPTVFVVGKDGRVKGKIIGPKTLDQLTSELAGYGIR